MTAALWQACKALARCICSALRRVAYVSHWVLQFESERGHPLGTADHDERHVREGLSTPLLRVARSPQVRDMNGLGQLPYFMHNSLRIHEATVSEQAFT